MFGKPRNLQDRSIFHSIALVPLLAWVGLGADGLSSSAYGPEEAFKTLGDHTYLAIGLAALTALTVFVIGGAYSRIIEHFPQGGGGYVVATATLGKPAGVASGCALLVDYVLTVTISIAAASDAIFSFLPREWTLQHPSARLWVDFAAISGLVVLNIRGVRESVTLLTPIFAVFVLTHLIVIVGGIVGAPNLGATATGISDGFNHGVATLGIGGLALLFMKAFSMGGGTYTGIEALSNGLPALREPRVQNGKRTMMLMAVSLAVCAAGLLILYLLWGVRPEEGKTMNASLIERMTESIPGGRWFAYVTIFSEGALLVVAAQAGFMDGPRVLSTMAVDSWMPRRFATLSERLTTRNGILIIGAAALIALVYTGGEVSQLIILYSINVFITFCISMFGMLVATWRFKWGARKRRRELILFGCGFLLCATILAVTVFEKFHEGGWVTLIITGTLVALCFAIKRHYGHVLATLNQLYAQLEKLPPMCSTKIPALDPTAQTAVLMVGGYGGLGIHTFGNIFRQFPGVYKNVVFISVGVLDSGEFKGSDSVDALKARVQGGLDQYLELAKRFGVSATSYMAIGTDVVEEAEQLCLRVAKDFPRCTFFAGKVIFKREAWYHRMLHNETANAVQKRLHWFGHLMIILPAKIQ